jgi:hypothetical protein
MELHLYLPMELHMYGQTYIYADGWKKGRQLEQNFEELNPASHVPILGTILNLFDVFVGCFFFSVKFFESCGKLTQILSMAPSNLRYRESTVICFCHDVAKKITHLALNNNQSLTL